MKRVRSWVLLGAVLLAAGLAGAELVGGYKVKVLDYGGQKDDSAVNRALVLTGTRDAHFLFTGGKWSITNSCTVPANVTVELAADSYFHIYTNQILTINGPFVKGRTTAFAGTGHVRGTSKVGAWYPEWGDRARYWIGETYVPTNSLLTDQTVWSGTVYGTGTTLKVKWTEIPQSMLMVTSTNITDASILLHHMASNSVSSATITNRTIQAEDIKKNTITTNELGLVGIYPRTHKAFWGAGVAVTNINYDGSGSVSTGDITLELSDYVPTGARFVILNCRAQFVSLGGGVSAVGTLNLRSVTKDLGTPVYFPVCSVTGIAGGANFDTEMNSVIWPLDTTSVTLKGEIAATGTFSIELWVDVIGYF